MRRIYLDHNATCPLRACARAAMLQVFDELPGGNASSAHADGRRARARLEAAREALAAAFDCARDEVVFTSGGTESNALALLAAGSEGLVAYSPIEHPSLLAPLRARSHPGTRASSAAAGDASRAMATSLAVALVVDREGRVDAEQLARLAPARPALVTVALANHELGVLQDGPRLAAAAHALGALVHADASQAAGREPLSFRALGADLVTLSAHKLGGPIGIGALLVRAGTRLPPLLRGGEQEGGLRAGTEPVALAAGFAAAAVEACAQRAESAPRWRAWRDELRGAIAELEPAALFNSPAAGCLANTLNVSFPGRPGSSLVHRLDLEGVSVSHGSACASGSLEPSPVLLACGLGEERARSAIRISLGPVNTPEDMAAFRERLARALEAVAPRAAV